MIGEKTLTQSTSFKLINNEQLITLDVGAQSFGENTESENSVFEISGIERFYCSYGKNFLN